MREVRAADGACWGHGVIFRELDIRILLGMEQIEKCPFLGVIGKRRITGSRPYSAIAFVDQIIERGLFAASVTPILAHLFMEPLRKSFRQAVGERFCDDGIIVVVFFFEPGAEFFEPPAGGDDKCSDVVRYSRGSDRKSVV